MKPEFSEFSYGFVLTNELVDRFSLRRLGVAPSLPSQYAEGQSGGGYDVKLPTVPIFLQFKLSDVLKSKSAKESGTLGLPYYRFKIWSKSASDQ